MTVPEVFQSHGIVFLKTIHSWAYEGTGVEETKYYSVPNYTLSLSVETSHDNLGDSENGFSYVSTVKFNINNSALVAIVKAYGTIWNDQRQLVPLDTEDIYIYNENTFVFDKAGA